MIGGVVDVDIVGDNAGLDAPFFPSLFSPLSLKMQGLVAICCVVHRHRLQACRRNKYYWVS